MIKLTKYLVSKLDKDIKLKLSIYSISIITTAILELFLISDLYKVIEILSEKTYTSNNLKESAQILLVAAIGATILRIYNLWFGVKIANDIGIKLSKNLFEKLIKQNYLYFTRSGSEKIVNLFNNNISYFIESINMIFNMLYAITMIFLILAFYSFMDFKKTIVVILTCVIFIAVILRFFKKSMKIYSETIAVNSRSNIKYLQETMRGIKDIIFSKNYDYYTTSHHAIYKNLRYSIAKIQFISSTPRFFIDGLLISIVSGLILYTVYFDVNSILNIGSFGVTAFVFLRITPYFQMVYSSIIGLKGVKVAINEIIEFDKEMIDTYSSGVIITFEKSIEIDNITYSFNNIPVLINFNLKINKGDKIGIIGKSGSGKTTLINLISGLIHPQIGKIIVDGISIDDKNNKSWQKKIAYISQDVFIANATLAENISFDFKSNDIDYDKLTKAIKFSHLEEFLETLPFGLDSMLEESGKNLSGGQRQRIAIARAMYLDSEVLIMDEPTSSLDEETEHLVMDSIGNLDKNKTLILVTHRNKLLSLCDKIIHII